MRFIGFRRDGGPALVGAVSTDGLRVAPLTTVEGFWSEPGRWLSGPVAETGELAITEVDLLPPVLPGARVLCVGLNYREHVAEGSYASHGMPEHPTIFARWTDSLSTDGVAIPVPVDEDGVDWEGEVVAWIGEPLHEATPEESLAAVVAYSTFNDVTSRRAQKLTSQWTLGKNGDRSGPLGHLVPACEVGDLRDGLRIQTRINGVTVQDASTADMAYSVGDTLSLISRSMTLRAGDLLATGTPAGVGYSRNPPWLLHHGDTVEVEVERLGTLTNPVVERSRPGGAR